MRDGELEGGGGVDVGRGDDGGEVTVREDLAGLAAEDGGLGDAGVGAADPDFFFSLVLVSPGGGKEAFGGREAG